MDEGEERNEGISRTRHSFHFGEKRNGMLSSEEFFSMWCIKRRDRGESGRRASEVK